MRWAGRASGWAAGTFLGQTDDNPFVTGLTPLQDVSWTFSQLSLNAVGGGAQQQRMGKAVVLFLGLGCSLLQLPSPTPAAVPPGPAMAQDLFKPHGFVKGHQKVLNLVKGEGAENNVGGGGEVEVFPAPIAHPISSLHLCRHSSQLPLRSLLPFHSPAPAKLPAQQGQSNSDVTLILPRGGSRGAGEMPTRQRRKRLCAARDNPGGVVIKISSSPWKSSRVPHIPPLIQFYTV